MSLLDKAVDALAARVDDQVPGWLASGIVRARVHLEEHPTQPVELGGGVLDVDSLAEDLLDAAEDEQAGLAEFGRARLLDAIALTGLGKKDEARRRWLMHEATFDERRRASAAADARAESLAERREAAWEAFERFAKKVGMVALRVGLPLLLAVL